MNYRKLNKEQTKSALHTLIEVAISDLEDEFEVYISDGKLRNKIRQIAIKSMLSYMDLDYLVLCEDQDACTKRP